MSINSDILTGRTAYWLIALGCAGAILFRLFGVLFFAASSSIWLAVPAAVLLLMLLAVGDKPGPAWIVALAGALYALSYWYGGWDRLKLRSMTGAGPVPDLPELALLVLLCWRWVTQRKATRQSP